MKPLVIMHYDESGWLNVMIDGDVTVLTVDDRVPHDRVYEHLCRDDRAAMEALAPPPWGNNQDDRHRATLTKLHRLQRGLRVVGTDTLFPGASHE